jgi:hypothetical protein
MVFFCVRCGFAGGGVQVLRLVWRDSVACQVAGHVHMGAGCGRWPACDSCGWVYSPELQLSNVCGVVTEGCVGLAFELARHAV